MPPESLFGRTGRVSPVLTGSSGQKARKPVPAEHDETGAVRLSGATTATLLEVAEHNTDRLRILINDLPDTGQLTPGRTVFHRTRQLLRPLLLEAIGDDQHDDAGRTAFWFDLPIADQSALNPMGG